MQPLALLGGVCTLLALVGYAAGVAAPYPGRELTLVGLMAGASLFFLGRGSA
ncbi:hypothetical protein [Halosegnis marinus]|uniref:XapX domain-containing protein n=1 Tax=Halosegnis marinus TaxID=3034023 RepID=A0ABD5ZS69_9EURY|nr:hypothetical protein [Halosegnis sp. DT85]